MPTCARRRRQQLTAVDPLVRRVLPHAVRRRRPRGISRWSTRSGRRSRPTAGSHDGGCCWVRPVRPGRPRSSPHAATTTTTRPRPPPVHRQRPPGGSATTAGGSATTAGGSATTAGAGSTDLATLLEIDPASAGKGKTIDLGAVLALTGTGSFYGKTMSRGLDLAAKHIEAAGGPTSSHLLDHKSGDPPAGVQAMAELVIEGRPGQVRVLRRRHHGDAAIGDGSTRCSRSTAAVGPGSPPRASPSSGAPGPSRPTTRCRAVQVDQGGLPGRQDGRRRAAGTSAPTTTRGPRGRRRQARGRRLQVQQALRARADRQPGLLPGAPEGEGQRARHPARS